MATHQIIRADGGSATPIVRMDRQNQRREDGLSTSLQIAKAAEHLACAELILQGWNAFLADAGLPYDLLADRGDGRFFRIQVKATCGMMPERQFARDGVVRTIQPVYRFALRRSRTGQRRITLDACDFLALVAIDIRAVAWLPVSSLTRSGGFVPGAVEFKSRRIQYRRTGSGLGGLDARRHGRFIEDFVTFDPSLQLIRHSGND